ncbi:MAG: hypothetical protein H6574_21580 [Lewinellaceae bacterium]|nr:hypothetical protein [Lewinellaceae bacterium]
MIHAQYYFVFQPFVLATAAFTQTAVQGTVCSTKGDTLIGANVWLQGRFDGATSGVDGQFSFQTTSQDPKPC